MKRIAVLNVGGDCPGLNAVIRSLIVKGAEENIEIIGVQDGFKGLVMDKMFLMTKEHVSGKLAEGGIILGSSKYDPTKNEDALKNLKENIKKYQITSLVLLTGHTGAEIALKLEQEGIPSVIIPATIDNDLPWTDLSVGFLTALQTITNSLDALHSTASAGHRVIVVEVGGDEAGWLATIGGMAGGADFILTPEIDTDPEDMVKNINKRYEYGKKFSIIVVEEKCRLNSKIIKASKESRPGLTNPSELVAEYLRQNMPETVDCKTVNLGYLQRGGSPSSFDRFIAFKFGVGAIEAIKKGKHNIAIGLKGFDITETPFTKDILINKVVREDIYNMAKMFF